MKVTVHPMMCQPHVTRHTYSGISRFAWQGVLDLLVISSMLLHIVLQTKEVAHY